MKRRYPLEPVRLARQREREGAARLAALAREQRLGAEAKETAARVERARKEHERGVVVSGEVARAEGGVVSAADLAALDRFQRDREAKAVVDGASEQSAARAAELARSEEATSHQTLHRARAAERVVEEHRARVQAEESREAERKAEEEAGDAWGARRRSPGGERRK